MVCQNNHTRYNIFSQIWYKKLGRGGEWERVTQGDEHVTQRTPHHAVTQRVPPRDTAPYHGND